MDLLSIFKSGAWSTAYSTIRGIFIFLDIALFIGFLFALGKGLKYRPNLSMGQGRKKETIVTLRKSFFEGQWKAIERKVREGAPDSFRIAIIEADALADRLLKQIGLKGEHMADRLERISSEELKSIERLWRAHRMRNNLVHTPGQAVTYEEAKSVLSDYEAFFKEVGVIN